MISSRTSTMLRRNELKLLPLHHLHASPHNDSTMACKLILRIKFVNLKTKKPLSFYLFKAFEKDKNKNHWLNILRKIEVKIINT